MGFDYVECDVSFTSDGVGVLLHDGTVDRTSNGTGRIADMTFEEARGLDFGIWFSDTFAGEKIPTFEEFIALCKYANLHPYIELKAGTEAQIAGLVDIVKKYGMKDGVSWISFNKNCLNYVKAKHSGARLGYVVDAIDETVIATAQGLKNGENEVFIDSAVSSATAENAELCMNADIPLEVWTVDDKNRILSLPPYVSGVSSDKTNANEVFYDNSAIDEKVVAMQGGDAVVYNVISTSEAEQIIEIVKNNAVTEAVTEIEAAENSAVSSIENALNSSKVLIGNEWYTLKVTTDTTDKGTEGYITFVLEG